LLAAIVLALVFSTCRVPAAAPPPRYGLKPDEAAFLDTLEERTFRYFWKLGDIDRGLVPDRWPTPSFCSVAAVGFGLTAYPIGVERHYIFRWQAVRRVKNTLRYLWTAKQGPDPSGTIGYKGFYYHFLDAKTGTRFEKVELSTQDTALLLAGVLFCQSYFNRMEADEIEIRALADSIYRRVDWNWAQTRPPLVSHGWNPEEGFLPYDWRGLNETMILHILALGSPTHPVTRQTYQAWSASCQWGKYYGQEHFGFPPLFGHQYTHVWIDLAGIQDSTVKAHGIDWFENSRRATLAQYEYAKDNPMRWRGYGPHMWGLTACDGPLDAKLTIDGHEREFHTYAARGASFTHVVDDGTVAPTAAGGSIPFAPEITIPTLMAMRANYGDHLFGKYGFVDAFNRSLDVTANVTAGTVVRDVGWFDTDYLGIDQGPILAMAENFRTGLVWETMRRNPYIVKGLREAGFTGGWLDRLGAQK